MMPMNFSTPIISIDLLKLCLLLFADDIVLLAESKEKLQQLLEIKEVYLEEKKLILNTSKLNLKTCGDWLDWGR